MHPWQSRVAIGAHPKLSLLPRAAKRDGEPWVAARDAWTVSAALRAVVRSCVQKCDDGAVWADRHFARRGPAAGADERSRRR